MDSSTVNLVSGRLVGCSGATCDIYRDGSWQHLQNTTASRYDHSSATTGDAVLLIGGKYSKSTEWIPVNGSAAQPGPFDIRHGYRHCTIQLSDNTLVAYMQKTCDVAEKAILAKKKLRKKCVNRDKM